MRACGDLVPLSAFEKSVSMQHSWTYSRVAMLPIEIGLRVVAGTIIPLVTGSFGSKNGLQEGEYVIRSLLEVNIMAIKKILQPPTQTRNLKPSFSSAWIQEARTHRSMMSILSMSCILLLVRG